jgi:hypothetical protein
MMHRLGAAAIGIGMLAQVGAAQSASAQSSYGYGGPPASQAGICTMSYPQRCSEPTVVVGVDTSYSGYPGGYGAHGFGGYSSSYSGASFSGTGVGGPGYSGYPWGYGSYPLAYGGYGTSWYPFGYSSYGYPSMYFGYFGLASPYPGSNSYAPQEPGGGYLPGLGSSPCAISSVMLPC